MLLGRVAGGLPPHGADGDADDGAEPEGDPPTVRDDHPGKERRGEAAASTNSGKDEAVRDSAFFQRNPARHELIRGGIDDGLSGPEDETDTNQEQNGLADSDGQHGRERGSGAPGQNAKGKYAAWTKAGGEPAGRNLKGGVTD